MTLTKEWLRKTIAELEEERDAVPGVVNEDAAKALAAMKLALASLEADSKLSDFFASQESLGVDFEKVLAENIEELYVPSKSTPPAPVSVPAAMEMDDDFDSAFEHGKAVGWNAYRDAMLKHSEPFIVTSDHRMMEMPQVEAINAVTAMLQGVEPVTTAYKLQDGWVACSERMPEIGIKVLCFPVNDEPIHATYNGQVWLQDISWSASDEPIDNVISCNVFHWMPLPAAPQQEA
ncbi:DUF551 domain-containing protein [Enterobacter hormaechei]|uniref:DUF551 domain-containing protein n=1 Tax=Enterobacter hormaechei TaxID=158836 RepID=UPI001BA98BA5|nr:DUF551 domain-containing protein [Enterobacter hormaechei]QUP92815.1 DUF551 domain-containing protein [Enterobacter hormaechei]